MILVRMVHALTLNTSKATISGWEAEIQYVIKLPLYEPFSQRRVSNPQGTAEVDDDLPVVRI